MNKLVYIDRYGGPGSQKIILHNKALIPRMMFSGVTRNELSKNFCMHPRRTKKKGKKEWYWSRRMRDLLKMSLHNPCKDPTIYNLRVPIQSSESHFTLKNVEVR